MEPPHRSVLPPLVKGASVHKRKKRITRVAEETLKEEEPWRVRKTSQRVSVDIDKRVVEHLKRRLLERIEKRTAVLNGDDVHKVQLSRSSPRRKSSQEPFDIFSKYSDTGDILHKKLLKAKRVNLTGGLTTQGVGTTDSLKQRISQSTIIEESENIRTSPGIYKSKTPNNGDDLRRSPMRPSSKLSAKPDAGETHVLNEDERDVNSLSLNKEVTSLSDIISRGDGDMFVLTNPKQDRDNNNISPIQTPYIWRPETRDQMRISSQEKKLKILHGNAHVRCPPEMKTLRLYVSSGDTDFETERGALMERVYPKLREFCLKHGCDIDICDLHWGARDAVWDDHVAPEFYSSHLEQCLNSPLGFTVLYLVGQRYGTSCLPCTIPRDEFQQIIEAARDEEKRIELLLNEETLDAIKEEPTRAIESVLSEVKSLASYDDGANDRTPRDIDMLNESRDSNMSQRKRIGSIVNGTKAARAARDISETLIKAELLETWYKLDENAKPPVYRLLNVSHHIPGIQRNDVTTRTTARNQWLEIRNKLRSLIVKMAAKCFTEENVLRKYNASALDIEIEHGLVEVDNEEEHALAISREFDKYESRLSDAVIGDYIDVIQRRYAEIDIQLAERARNIRDIVKDKICPTYNHSYTLPWKRDGLVPETCRPHATYLEKMCRAVYDNLTESISRAMTSKQTMSEEEEMVYDEVAQHVRHFQEVASEFQGQKDALTKIKAYLRSEYSQPFVIYGQTGCGKTAVLGKAAKDCHKWFKGVEVNVVVRSIGVSNGSRNIRQLLHGLNLQLSIIYNQPAHIMPTDYKGLCNYFAQITGKSTADNPLFIFIDALDHLSGDNDGRKLNWLPKEDQPHTRILLSASQDTKYECLSLLKKLFNNKPECFLQIPLVSDEDAIKIVDHWLNRKSRTLTQIQLDILMSKFRECRSPLFLKLAFHEVVDSASYVDGEKIKLAANVKKLAALKFGMLEREFGEPFVRRCIGYITASRNGLTRNEMLDVLSIDETAMDEVKSNFTLTKRRLPPILLVRVLDKLQSYILYCRTDGVIAIHWRHAEIHDAAVERYHDQKDRAPSYHKILAEYFLGRWFSTPKPYSGNEQGSLRYVMSQSLYTSCDEIPDEGCEVYNVRRISELPHHLLNSQQMDMLKREALCNFDFLQGKVLTSSVGATLEEIQTALSIDPHDVELKLLSDTLQLSALVIHRDPKQLASQIVGRLHRIITKDVPVSHSDPVKYPFLQSLFTQAHKCQYPCLIPSNLCLTEPGGVLFDLLSGHSEPITAVAVTSGGMQAVTTSMDGTLKMWDLRSGRVTKTIPGVGTGVRSVKLAMGNVYAVTAYVDAIRIWSLRSNKCVYVIDEYDDPASIATADDGKLLIAVYDGSNFMRVWNLEKEEIELLNEKRLLSDNVHKNNSIVISGNVYGDVVLYAARGAKIAHAQKARSDKAICSLECHEPSSLIMGLGVSRDYFIVACKQQYMKLHEIHQLELFDNRKATYLRSVRGCMSDVVDALHINQSGTHALAICSSEQSNLSDIAIWNLETDEHKHMGRHSGVSTMCACADFRFCLTAGKEDNTLRIWNLSNDVNKPAPKQHTSSGIGQIVPMVDNQRYIVARGLNNGPVTVWNVAKAKCLQTAVRIERGLGDQTDVVLIRKMKIVILTDRGFSAVSQDSKPIFQTILIYDLNTKKYDKKITGCFITPSPASEYVLLEHHLLLGLSESRTHFIVWDLWTGREVYRMRTSFKEIEKMAVDGGFVPKERHFKSRATTAKMTPWDRRSESVSARDKRRTRERQEDKHKMDMFKKERENAIDRYIISKNENIIVASYFAHHLCLFNLDSKSHVQVLEDETSMLFLYTSALTENGSYIVLANYDEESKISYVTLWDCVTGQVKRRVKNEPNVCVMAIADDADKVVFGKTTNELRIWEPMKSNSIKRIKGYPGQVFSINSKIVICNHNRQAIVFAGDISVWDLTAGNVLAVFTPDTNIQCFSTSLDGKVISFGLSDNPHVVTLKLTSKDIVPITDTEGKELFGETTGDTTDEDEDDEES